MLIRKFISRLIDTLDKRTYILLNAGSTPASTKAAMDRPQRSRGLATDPGVQRKAPMQLSSGRVPRLEEQRNESPRSVASSEAGLINSAERPAPSAQGETVHRVLCSAHEIAGGKVAAVAEVRAGSMA